MAEEKPYEEKPYDPRPIEDAIRAHGYSYQEAAVYADLSPTTLTLIRKADPGVKISTLRKLGEALNLQVEIRFIQKTEPEVAGTQ